MTDASITWDLIARDRASATVGRVGDSVEGLTKRVGHLAAAFGGAIAFQQAGRFALEMADQFEASRSRLETITKNIGGNFTALQGQVQAADDRMAKLGFTSAATESSLAALEGATRDPVKAFKDLALAADIARGRNITLEESTRILQRAETGHVSSLARLGIATKDAAGHTLSLQAILQKLTNLYGGSASHYADTFAGKQEALKAAIGNSAAQIGVALLPALVDLATVIQHDVLPPIESAAQFFDRNRKTIEPLVGTIIKLTLAYKGLKLVQKGLETLRVGSAATAASSGALNLASRENPVPVFVTNPGFGGAGGGGGGTPVVATGEKAAATDAAATGEAVGAGLVLRAGLGRLPLYAVGAQSDMKRLSDAQVTAQFQKLATSQAGLKKIQDLYTASVREGHQADAAFYAGIIQGAGATVRATHTQKDLAAATADTTAKVRDQAKALGNAQSKSLALSSAQGQLRQAVHNMAVTAGQSGKALLGNSDAALANQDALRGAVQSAEDYLATLKKQHVSQRVVAATAVALSKAIRDNAAATYGNKAAVDSLLKSLHSLPSQISAALEGTVGAAERIGEGIMEALAVGIRNATPVAVQQAQVAASQTLKVARLAAGLDSGTNVAGSLLPVPSSPKAKKIGVDFANSLVSGYSPVVDAGVKAATDKAFAAAKSRIEADFQRMKALFSQEQQALNADVQARASVVSGIVNSIYGGADISGAYINGRVGNISGYLNNFARSDKRLLRDVRQLRLRGLDDRLLSQIANAGPIGGVAIAESILSGQSGSIAHLNALDSGLHRYATRTGQIIAGAQYDTRIEQDRKNLRRAADTLDEIRNLMHHLTKNSNPREVGDAVAAALEAYVRGRQHQHHSRVGN